jgi:hypothetical protein
MNVINHKNANQNIKNKAKGIIPKTLSLIEKPNYNIRVFYYSDKYKNIIGYILLKNRSY